MKDSGVLFVDKPTGMTSFGVVARVRRMLSEHFNKKIKVGHTGTLDPFATGLMIIVVGKECKKANTFSKLDKVYEATIYLGKTSSTGDPEGEISDISDIIPAESEIRGVLKKFTGEITQCPPVYSAIKINGERAYKLARKGEKIEIPKRKVNIYKLEQISYKYPEIKIKIHVSSGTYIRSLAEDIGKELQTGAYCTQLRRVSVGKWSIDNVETFSLPI